MAAWGRPDRGSFLGPAGYELRVTARCCTEDLHESEGTTFADLGAHPIVAALRNKHHADPATTKTIGPAAGARTLGRLGIGDDHRGAVWFDREHGVLWLCAAHDRHRSGAADDAFPYFGALIAAGRIYPTADDYEALEQDRAARLVDAIPGDAQALLERARAAPGVELTGQVGPVRVRLVVVRVEDVADELFVAISMRHGDDLWLTAVLVGFRPDTDDFDVWRSEMELPTGELDRQEPELGYSTVLT